MPRIIIQEKGSTVISLPLTLSNVFLSNLPELQLENLIFIAGFTATISSFFPYVLCSFLMDFSFFLPYFSALISSIGRLQKQLSVLMLSSSLLQA